MKFVSLYQWDTQDTALRCLRIAEDKHIRDDTAVHAVQSSVLELVNQLQNELAAGRSAAVFSNVTHVIHFRCRSCGREDLQTCISPSFPVLDEPDG